MRGSLCPQLPPLGPRSDSWTSKPSQPRASQARGAFARELPHDPLGLEAPFSLLLPLPRPTHSQGRSASVLAWPVDEQPRSLGAQLLLVAAGWGQHRPLVSSWGALQPHPHPAWGLATSLLLQKLRNSPSIALSAVPATSLDPS